MLLSGSRGSGRRRLSAHRPGSRARRVGALAWRGARRVVAVRDRERRAWHRQEFSGRGARASSQRGRLSGARGQGDRAGARLSVWAARRCARRLLGLARRALVRPLGGGGARRAGFGVSSAPFGARGWFGPGYRGGALQGSLRRAGAARASGRATAIAAHARRSAVERRCVAGVHRPLAQAPARTRR